VSPAMPVTAAGLGQYRGHTRGSRASAAAPGASMAAGVATVLAKMDALIAAIGKESGFLEKVLS
jgi:hypothetical protein